MYKKIIINLLLIFALGICQISFIYGLPTWFKNINLIIIFIVFILSYNGYQLAFWWTVGAGLVLDMYSFAPWGTNFFSLMVTLMIINFLLVNFFTNRSLYSFAILTMSASISYRGIFILLYYFINKIVEDKFRLQLNPDFFVNEISGLFLNLLSVIIIFYLLTYISRRFKPVFLKIG